MKTDEEYVLFLDQGCYALLNKTLNSTDLDLGNPELGNETR